MSIESPSTPRAIPSDGRRFILGRDVFFIFWVAVALSIVFWVESHPGISGSAWLVNYFHEPKNEEGPNSSIFDFGFLITTPLYRLLSADDNLLNDVLAGINSALLFLALPYVFKTTFWDADYTLGFRVVATQLFRATCGFFTFLPPSPEFLPSYWDCPEAIYCIVGTVDCSVPPDRSSPLPFVTFFSGHVATCVIIGNHMYTRGYVKSGVLMHLINMLQIIRLLATRGHYSIDIIIAWVVAVYVSGPAERLGTVAFEGLTTHSVHHATGVV